MWVDWLVGSTVLLLVVFYYLIDSKGALIYYALASLLRKTPFAALVPVPDKVTDFQISETSNYLRLDYTYLNRPTVVYLPIIRTHRTRKVRLLKDGNEFLMALHPGVPVLVPAKALGGTGYRTESFGVSSEHNDDVTGV